MDDMVCFADDRGALRAHRNALGDWLWEERRLRLNVRKGHIRSTEQPHTYLGYRVTRRGFDLGPRASRRFRTWLADAVAAGDEEKLDRGLASLLARCHGILI